MDIVVKRIQDGPRKTDGTRVLVDRVWPRGVSKDEAELDDWNLDVAPTTERRQWCGHDPERFEEFAQRYCEELDSAEGRAALDRLRESVRGKRLTLLTGTRDVEHSQAAVLKDLLED